LKSFNPPLKNTANCKALKRKSSFTALIPDQTPSATSKKHAKSTVYSKLDSHPIQDNRVDNAPTRSYPERIANSRRTYWLRNARLTNEANIGRHKTDPNKPVRFQTCQFEEGLGRLRGGKRYNRTCIREAEERNLEIIEERKAAEDVIRRIGPIEQPVWTRPPSYDLPYHSDEVNIDPAYSEERLSVAFDIEFHNENRAAGEQFATWWKEANELTQDPDFCHWRAHLINQYATTRGQDDEDESLEFKGALLGRTPMPLCYFVKKNSSDAMMNASNYYTREMRTSDPNFDGDPGDPTETPHVMHAGKIPSHDTLKETKLRAYYKNRYGNHKSMDLVNDPEFKTSALNYTHEVEFHLTERMAELEKEKPSTLRKQFQRERERFTLGFDFDKVSDFKLRQMAIGGGYWAEIPRKNQTPEIRVIYSGTETGEARAHAIDAAIYKLFDDLRTSRIESALKRSEWQPIDDQVKAWADARKAALEFVKDNVIRESRMKFFDAGLPGELLGRLKSTLKQFGNAFERDLAHGGRF